MHDYLGVPATGHRARMQHTIWGKAQEERSSCTRSRSSSCTGREGRGPPQKARSAVRGTLRRARSAVFTNQCLRGPWYAVPRAPGGNPRSTILLTQTSSPQDVHHHGVRLVLKTRCARDMAIAPVCNGADANKLAAGCASPQCLYVCSQCLGQWHGQSQDMHHRGARFMAITT